MPSKSKTIPDTFRTPRLRKFSLETPTSRSRLAVRKTPYRHRIGPGRSLGYRRNQKEGTWSAIITNADGQEPLTKIGIADDREPADGKRVLSFDQAIETVRKLADGDTGDNLDGPTTPRMSLAAYALDLKARGAGAYNAKWSLVHLPRALLDKPIVLIESAEWRRFRDRLLEKKLKPASVNRLMATIVAALNQTAEHDPRIKSFPWRTGLQKLPGAAKARNVILTDDQVRAFTSAAYAMDDALGLFVDVMANAGARPSQIARLEVGDLRAADLTQARLMVPRSGKGGGRDRSEKLVERIGVPITEALAKRLKAAAVGRPFDAPLLIRSDGKGWGPVPHVHYRHEVREIVAGLGLDPDKVTLYALRHSSIVRNLLANVPIRIVANAHDTRRDDRGDLIRDTSPNTPTP